MLEEKQPQLSTASFEAQSLIASPVGYVLETRAPEEVRAAETSQKALNRATAGKAGRAMNKHFCSGSGLRDTRDEIEILVAELLLQDARELESGVARKGGSLTAMVQRLAASERGPAVVAQVRKTPNWPRSWANFSLL